MRISCNFSLLKDSPQDSGKPTLDISKPLFKKGKSKEELENEDKVKGYLLITY